MYEFDVVDDIIRSIVGLAYLLILLGGLAIGIVFIVKKMYIPVGGALCIPSILFCIFLFINIEVYGFILPQILFFYGILLIITGILVKGRLANKQNFKLPILLIIMGIVSLLYWPFLA